MKHALKNLVLPCLLLMAPVLAACGSDDESGHTANLGGIGHRDGYADPLTHCVGCHGASLHGGSGPNCYDCHDADDHQTIRNGVRHNQPEIDCTSCHGPSRTRGGVGPACVQSGCHAA